MLGMVRHPCHFLLPSTDHSLDEGSFERDAVTAQLENHASGQGHRANLKRAMAAKSHGEERDSRLGDERRLWLQENNLPLREPRATSGQERFAREVFGRKPVAQSMLGNQNTPGRARDRTARAPNMNRAPSPRSFGKTRFVHDQAVSGPGSKQPTHGHPEPTKQATVNADPPLTDTPPPQLHHASKAVPIRAPSPSTRSNASTRSRRSNRRGFRNFQGFNDGNAFRALKPLTKNILLKLDNPAAVEVYRIRAEWYAATPGTECDLYHDKFPDRKPFLFQAMRKLAGQAILLVKAEDARDIQIYIETHPERQWMVDAAKEARSLVENSTHDEIEMFCQGHPSQEGFVRLATSHFTPIARRDSVVAEKDQDVSMADAAPEELDAMMEQAVINDGNEDMNVDVAVSKPQDAVEMKVTYKGRGFQSKSNDHATPATLSYQPEHAQPANGAQKFDSPMATSSTKPPHERIMKEKREFAKKRGQEVEEQAENEKKDALEARLASLKEAGKSRKAPEPEAAPSSKKPMVETLSVTTVQASQAQPTQPVETLALASTGTNGISDEFTAAKEPDLLGTLTATFYSITGSFMGIHQKAIVAPVMATMNVVSKSPEYDPKELVQFIDEMAESMMQKARAEAAITSSGKANGVNGSKLGLVDYGSDDDEEL